MVNPFDRELYIVLRDLTLLAQEADKFIMLRHGLRMSRFYILHHLYHEPGLTLGQLTERALLFSASASRTVYSLEQEGLVEREDDKNDRRLFTLSLTADGRSFYEKVSADLDADIAKRFETVDSETKASLIEKNRRLCDLLQAHRQWQMASEVE